MASTNGQYAAMVAVDDTCRRTMTIRKQAKRTRWWDDVVVVVTGKINDVPWKDLRRRHSHLVKKMVIGITRVKVVQG